MIDKELAHLARRVICEILEGAAFVFTNEYVEELPDKEWSAIGTKISFHGSTSGTLHMWAPKEFLTLCASNMLGIDEDDIKAKDGLQDAAKELLNMIVGLFVTEQYGDDSIFDLSIPEVIPHTELEKDIISDTGLWVQAEDLPLFFNFYLEGK